jgi:hypothetical protein
MQLDEFYIQIDSNGDPISGWAFIDPINIFYLMDNTWDFTNEELTARGFAPVINSRWKGPPNGDSNIDREMGEIVKNDDGTFTQLWIENEIPIAEKRVRFMDRTRFNLLYQSDWTQAVDSPLSAEKKAAWAEYRQALRDLPVTVNWETITSSADVVWPLLPGVTIPDPGTPLPTEE